MSLDPSPLSPTPTPLLNPTDPAPGRGAALVGACISVLLAVVVGFVSMHFGTRLIYLPAGIKANTQEFQLASPFQVQGFNYQWVKSYGTSNSMGYQSDTVNTNILKSEANDYHMNLVVITVVGDINGYNLATPRIATTIDAYSDSVYESVAATAIKYNLTPVFKLELRVLGGDSNKNGAWSGNIGSQWTANQELNWVNQYTLFAAHYAQLAQKLNMPFFIFGSELDQLTVDTPDTAGKPKLSPDDGITSCQARRDCEWRHIIAAVKNSAYVPLGGGPHQQGGGYSGKLIYAATSNVGLGSIGKPEWQDITWWDAVDYIGIDAFFPLTAGTATSTAQIQSAWHGDTSHGTLAPANTTDLFSAFNNLANKFGKPILFTGAGYESTSGSNTTPGSFTTGQQRDDNEQLNDMQGLLETFSNQPWWLGVVWSSDYAIWPRDSLIAFNSAPSDSQFFRDGSEGFSEGNSEPTWQTNTEWAGDCLSASFSTCSDGHASAKAAGLMLNHTYTVKPIPPQSG